VEEVALYQASWPDDTEVRVGFANSDGTGIYPNLQREFVNLRGPSRRRPNKSIGFWMSAVIDAETGADYHVPPAARQARPCHDQDAASKEVG
jgi:hypothetical protein